MNDLHKPLLKDPSNRQPERKPVQPPRGRWFKAITIIGSVGVMLWSFSTVLQRSSVSTSVIATPVSAPVDPVEKVTYQQPDSHEFRDAAIELDRAFMKSLANRPRFENTQPVLAPDEFAATWETRTESIRKRINSYADVQPGTVEWDNRESLQAVLEDLPE
ncbi:hypothetical protein Poly51_01810 [Rubripirellula tenax]|uniref:Uncharacterized protein n=1 Tax=Rubripirellula tenax TaxID=2528015 RepID=A0A5C6FET8_9BACT|nr:hypothetical protein [Rubripirellula tenax]TWU59908.1 hypothetical protein Poly51_01810 [Rubripirellula tenax]